MNDEKIRQRAYELWEAEGRPEGRDIDHWMRAQAELAAYGMDSPAAPKRPARAPRNQRLDTPRPAKAEAPKAAKAEAPKSVKAEAPKPAAAKAVKPPAAKRAKAPAKV